MAKQQLTAEDKRKRLEERLKQIKESMKKITLAEKAKVEKIAEKKAKKLYTELAAAYKPDCDANAIKEIVSKYF